jgi:hypothetical protein
VRRLIAARVPDLTEADLRELSALDTLPAAIGEQILDVIAHMADRLDKIERAVRAGSL